MKNYDKIHIKVRVRKRGVRITFKLVTHTEPNVYEERCKRRLSRSKKGVNNTQEGRVLECN